MKTNRNLIAVALLVAAAFTTGTALAGDSSSKPWLHRSLGLTTDAAPSAAVAPALLSSKPWLAGPAALEPRVFEIAVVPASGTPVFTPNPVAPAVQPAPLPQRSIRRGSKPWFYPGR